MLFELHITAEHEAKKLDHWVRWNNTQGYKPLLIGLTGSDGIQNPTQMMNAIVFECDDVGEAYLEMCKIVADVHWSFKVIRIKLETPMDHSHGLDVAYYEAHVKALLDQDEAWLIPDAAEKANMHASFNSLKVLDDGFNKWYLTKRWYGDSFLDAAAAFNSSYTRMLKVLPTAVRIEKEAVLFDSNPKLDAGWAGENV